MIVMIREVACHGGGHVNVISAAPKSAARGRRVGKFGAADGDKLRRAIRRIASNAKRGGERT